MRGFYGVGIYHPKTAENIGTLWRTAHNMGANFIFTIGPRYKRQSSDTTKAWKTVPLWEFKSFAEFKRHMPTDSRLICVEQDKKSMDLVKFVHPERAIYLLGAEDHGIPKRFLSKELTIEIPSKYCLNVAVAGSIVMYDRLVKSYGT